MVQSVMQRFFSGNGVVGMEGVEALERWSEKRWNNGKTTTTLVSVASTCFPCSSHREAAYSPQQDPTLPFRSNTPTLFRSNVLMAPAWQFIEFLGQARQVLQRPLLRLWPRRTRDRRAARELVAATLHQCVP